MSDLKSRYEKCLINIKIISKLNPYDRLKFGHEYVCIRQYNIFLGIIRYFSGESRDDIINGLNNLYNELECICAEYIKLFAKTCNGNNGNNDCDIEDRLKMLLNELGALYTADNKGLCALLVTYNVDSATHSKIDVLIEKFKRISLVIEDTLNFRIKRQSRIDRSRSE